VGNRHWFPTHSGSIGASYYSVSVPQHLESRKEVATSIVDRCASARFRGPRILRREFSSDVIQVKRVYNLFMTVFRYEREHYEEGEFVRRKDAVPGDGLDPVVRIVEDLGTIEVPCGKVDCRANCLEYLVRSTRRSEDYALAECKISPLVSII